MPLDLTTPISVKAVASASAGRLEVRRILIDAEEKRIDVGMNWVQGDGTKIALDGSLVLLNHARDLGWPVSLAGKALSLPKGSWFDQAAGAAASGITNYAVIKAGIYAALAAAYPELVGVVS